MAQPIKRTVGFAIAGDEDETAGASLALRAGGDEGVGMGSPDPVFLTPHGGGGGGAGSLNSSDSAIGSADNTRGVRPRARARVSRPAIGETPALLPSPTTSRPHPRPPRPRVRSRRLASSPRRAPHLPHPPPRSQITEIMRNVRMERHDNRPAPRSGAAPGAIASSAPPQAPPVPDPPAPAPPTPSAPTAAAAPTLAKTASDASSTASSSFVAASSAADADAAARKAAKEARKAAHLAERQRAGDADQPKKQLTRAERRAQQEAQKAAKEAKKVLESENRGDNNRGGGKPDVHASSNRGGEHRHATSADRAGATSADQPSTRQAQKAERARDAAASARAKARPGGRLADHFSHLRPFDPAGSDAPSVRKTLLAASAGAAHPAVARLAAHYADGTIAGGRARCVALLHALKMVIADFRTPPDAKYAHALTQCVNSVVQHLQSARPMAVSMGNAVKSLKTHLARMSEEPASCEEESRRKTLIHLEYFEQEKLLKAGRSIAEHGASEIRVGDVVVAHGASHHAREILREARRRGVDFRVVVVDSGVNREARETLRALLRENIACTYTTLGGLGYVFREGGATKVLLGAAAVLANGAVVSRAGAAVVAACAAAADVPVLVAAETCKFHERVHLDAVAHNELGNPACVVEGPDGGGAGGDGPSDGPGDATGDAPSPLRGWEEVERLAVVHLAYDVTPASCVASVVCESGLVAPADIPSFLR